MYSESIILVTYPDEFIINEAKSLVESIPNYKVIRIFTQKFLKHAKYGMGAGKAEEIKEFISKNFEIKKLVIDEHLNPKQIFNIESFLNISVSDREQLILDIFYSKSSTSESKLQIQLAEIQYRMPKIRNNAKLMSKSNERAGKGGMGEYIVDVQFRDLKRQLYFIKDKLKDQQSRRLEYRKQREKKGMYLVSLVGYTSSGKTTLFNLLTKENKKTSPTLFTTLSTTTRSINFSNSPHFHGDNKVLLIDTVGFISRLPHYMIDAFKSTLEESLEADIILLLIDCSEEMDNIGKKYSSCLKVLEELDVDKSKIALVLTKAEKVKSEYIEQIIEYVDKSMDKIVISSKTGYGIKKLKNLIITKMQEEKKIIK